MAVTTGPAAAVGRRPTTRSSDGWRRRERLLASVMVLPQAIPFLLFTLVPLGWAVYLSFTSYDGFSSPSWVGLHNYSLLIHDRSWWQAVQTTFIFSGAKMAIEIPLALGLALLLNRRIHLGNLFRTIFFMPHVISIAVMGVIFYFLLRPEAGIVNGLLNDVGILHSQVDWLGHRWTALGSLVAVGVWSGFGINTVLFLVGLQTVPRELYESARTDGASAWQQFRFVTLPLLSPMLRVITILTIVSTLRSFDLVKTLTDGGPAGGTDVMFTYLFSYYFSSDNPGQFGYASALSVAASIIIAIVSLIYLYLSRQRDAVGPTTVARSR